MVFRYGIGWVNWLTGRWPQARALWDTVRTRWAEDAGNIYPSAGPIAAIVEIEAVGPEAGRQQLLESTARLRKTGTWRAALWAEAYEANLWLAEGEPGKVLDGFKTILSRRPPSMLDVEDFALTTRAVLPAALQAADLHPLALWIDDPGVAAAGEFYLAGVHHARAVDALLRNNHQAAEEWFGRASEIYRRLGWSTLLHELAWQRAKTGSPAGRAAVEAALNFYDEQGAIWRKQWLADQAGVTTSNQPA